MSVFQIGQSDLGLEQRQYYLNESQATRAYRQFINDLALSLSNNSTTIEDDVRDIYEFEKKIASVSDFISDRLQMLKSEYSFLSFIGHLLNNEQDKTKLFARPLAIFHEL